jgi:hypothetical protein
MQTELQLQIGISTPGADSTPQTVRILRSIEEVESLRSFWSTRSGLRDSDIDVFLTTFKNTPAAIAPYVVVLYRGGDPTALMAGRIDHRRLSFRVGYVSLFKPLAKVITFTYGALRGDASPDNCDRLVREVIASLKKGEADVALLEYIDADSFLASSAKRMPGLLARDYFSPIRPHRKRQLPGSVGQMYAALSGNERKHFRKISKFLTSTFSVQLKIDLSDKPGDLERTLQVVEEIAKKTWQRTLGNGFAISSPIVEFFKTQAERGWLRTYLLYLEDKPCAFWIGAVYQGTFFSDFMGYDPEYARYSPGMYLLSRMMEDFCSQGVQAIDFGFSDEEWKRRFGNVQWAETTRYVFALTPKGLRLSAMKAITVLLHEPARALLARTNLVARAKKGWRRIVADKQSPQV